MFLGMLDVTHTHVTDIHIVVVQGRGFVPRETIDRATGYVDTSWEVA